MVGLKITGGNSLKGIVQVGGSKNAALAIMAGALLVKDELVLHHFPVISDTLLMVELLECLGVKTQLDGHSLYIDARNLTDTEPPESIVRRMRASFYVMGPILARMGHAKIPMPGGCKIGVRPVDFHIKGFKSMGAHIVNNHGAFEATATQLIGSEIYLDFPSAGATQHLMTAACLAHGNTVIQNAAMEPEVVDLAYFLNKMGARIEGAGTSCITVQGVTNMHGNEYTLISDRLQAGTFMLGAAMTQGDVTVDNVQPEHMNPLVSKMKECGIKITEGHNWVRVSSKGDYNATDIKTMPHPGFPTDMQQPICSLLTLAKGASTITETIYESRSKHVHELQRMGADIKVLDGRSILIKGVLKLTGARVEGHDLRGGAALVIAALAAEGESLITGLEYIDRGYQDFENHLTQLGASVQRVETAEEQPVVSIGP